LWYGGVLISATILDEGYQNCGKLTGNRVKTRFQHNKRMPGELKECAD